MSGQGEHRGRCLCGAVSFAISGPMKEAVACHCTMCRRQSGNFWVSTNVAVSDLAIDGVDKVRWFRSSEVAERGFCGACGSFLFWRRPGFDRIAVALGALDKPTGVAIGRHIFTADKGDYYEIPDGVEQFPGDD